MSDKDVRRVIVMSGIPGSGKSLYAQKILADSSGLIVSTDDYYITKGRYVYDRSKIGQAHADCFRKFIEHIKDSTYRYVVVDNTNTTVAEIAPYILAATAFGWEPEVRTIMCANVNELKIAAARNAHGVSFASVLSLWMTLRNRELPTWWTNTDIPMGG